MRPLELTLKAFGPHEKEITFDMESLGTEGIYLLSGPTGAGKTTLFDGISYALYGESSGKDRLDLHLRNRMVVDKEKTVVRMKFSVGSGLYEVERSFRISNGVNGRKKSGTAASFTTFRGNDGVDLATPEIISGIKPVNEKISEVVKVQHKEFTQIAMIAQGSFQKVLLEKTDDRTEVYNTIFGTQHFRDLQTRLETEYKKLNSLVADSDERMKIARASFVFYEEEQENQEELTRVWEQIRDNYYLPDLLEQIETLGTYHGGILSGYQIKQNGFSDGLGKIQKFEGSLQAAKGWQKSWNTNSVELQKSEENLLQSLMGMGKLVPTYPQTIAQLLEETQGTPKHLEHDENAPKKTSLNEKLSSEFQNNWKKLTELKGVWDRYHTGEGEILSTETKRKNAEEIALVEAKEKLEVCTADITKTKEYVEGLVGLDVKRVTQLALVEEKKTAIVGVNQLLGELSEVQKLEKNMEKCLHRLLEAGQLKNTQATIENQGFLSYISEQSGILGAELNLGDTCMVCGNEVRDMSLVACLSEQAITSEKLDLLKKNTAEAGRAESLAQTAYDTSKEKTNGKASQVFAAVVQGLGLVGVETGDVDSDHSLSRLKECVSLADGETGFEGLVRELNRKIKEIPVGEAEDELKKIDVQLANREKAKTTLSRLETQVLTIQKNVNTIESDIKSFSDQLLRLRESREKYLETLQGETGVSLQTEIDAVELNVRQLKFVEQCLGSYQSLSQVRAMLDGQESENDFSAILKQEEEKLAEKRVVQESIAENNGKIEKLSQIMNLNHQKYDQIKELLAEAKETRAQLNLMKPIYNIACNSYETGEAKHGLSMKLETYVQSYYFDEVLIEANLVYQEITGGRYRLSRGEKAGRGRVGLDLFVEDASGDQREVATLSGGEAFQASLSLALGLSSSVQKNSGAVQIESLFLDEGFGSLDQESLEMAVKALVSVAGSGRLVGVISHVERLKEMIDKKILFSSDNGNYKAKFVV